MNSISRFGGIILMNEKIYKNNIGLLISWSMSFYIMLLGLNSFINKIWKNTSIDSYFLSLIYVVIAIKALRTIVTNIDVRALVSYGVVAAVVTVGSILNDSLNNFAFTVGIFIIVGYVLDDFKSMEGYMINCTILASVAAGLHIICTLLDSGYVHDMVSAYSFLPMAVFSSYLFVYKNNVLYKILAVVSGFIIFVFATRGPLLLYIICTAIIVLQSFLKKQPIGKVASFVFIVAFLTMFYLNYETIMNSLSNLLESYGMNNGVLNRYFDNSLTDDNGRNLLKTMAFDKISQNLFIGYGSFADRRLLGTYCHSIYMEFMIDYGVFAGLGLLVIYLYGAAKLLLINRHNGFVFAFLISVYSVAIGKLFLSGSYLEQPEFFLVLGILLNKKNFIKNAKKESGGTNEENIDS